MSADNDRQAKADQFDRDLHADLQELYRQHEREHPLGVDGLRRAAGRGHDVTVAAKREFDEWHAKAEGLAKREATRGLLASEQRQLAKARGNAAAWAQLLTDLEFDAQPVRRLTYEQRFPT